MKENIFKYKKFIAIAIFSIAITLYISYEVADTIFGDNSYSVYSSLKHKKEYLEEEIVRLQKNNAYLQKEYLELKNLEPE